MTDSTVDSAHDDDADVSANDPEESADDARTTSDSDVRVIDRRWWARSEDDKADDGPRSDKPSYIEALEKRLEDKDVQLTNYAAKYKAAADEFEQTRIRLRREISKDIEREKRDVLAAFLDVVDNIDRAIDAARSTADDNPTAARLVEGVELVKQQFLSTLEGFGVTPIDAAGQPFDPNLHDAISTVPVDEPDQTDVVIDVIKVGYAIGEDVLRPASVTVGKVAPEPR